MKYPVFSHVREIRSFLLKKVLRLYPLYVPALFLFVLLFAQLGVWDQWALPRRLLTIVVHLLGAQILLSPAISPMNTLWFVGCIMLYYSVYIILAWYGSDAKRFMAAAIAVFAVTSLIRGLIGCIEYRFFCYYPIFVGGIGAARIRIMEVTASRNHSVAGMSVGLLGMIIAGAFLWIRGHAVHDYAGQGINSFAAAEGICLLYSISGILFSICLCSIVVPHLHKTALTLVLCLSASSYAVYLFHRPIFALLASGCRTLLGTTGYSFDLAVIAVGFPATLAAGYCLQHLSDVLVRLPRK